MIAPHIYVVLGESSVLSEKFIFDVIEPAFLAQKAHSLPWDKISLL